ncbi:Uncharacterised protein [Mycobacteroides abscessus subsp. abscessus]|nr:Uncharacterised protein [Mycobacteroides abscessus subsp. abscessus]
MPNCISNPSAVCCRVGDDTPALLTRMSTGSVTEAAPRQIESRSAKSTSTTACSLRPPRNVCATAAPRLRSRTASRTLAPASAAATAVARPIPLLAPVISTVCPVRAAYLEEGFIATM